MNKDIWDKAILVFDTSAIIELYYYSDTSLTYIINSLFPKLENRLFITKQIQYEFSKHKDRKKNAAITRYNELKKSSKNMDSGYLSKINKNIKDIQGIINTLCNETGTMDKHPWLEKDKTQPLITITEKYSKELNEQIVKIEERINYRINDIKNTEDLVFKTVNEKFKVGPSMPYSEKFEIAKEGRLRYEMDIPPGYMDARGNNAKEGIAKFGDLFIWKQMINLSKIHNVPIIFVTNDLKLDWCIKQENNQKRIKQPRQELIEEFLEETNQEFVMFSLAQFLYESQKPLGIKMPSNNSLQEIELTSISIPLNASNNQSDFWGYTSNIIGKCIISENVVEVQITAMQLKNRKDFGWLIKEMTLNISKNTFNSWTMVSKGLPLIINSRLEINQEKEFSNLSLSVNRKNITDLSNYHLTFSILGVADINRNGGFTYIQWKKLLDIPK